MFIIPIVAKPYIVLNLERIVWLMSANFPDDSLSALVGSQHDLWQLWPSSSRREAYPGCHWNQVSFSREAGMLLCQLLIHELSAVSCLGQPNVGSCHSRWPEDPDKTSNIWHLVSYQSFPKEIYEKSDLERRRSPATDQLKEYSPLIPWFWERFDEAIFRSPAIKSLHVSGIERFSLWQYPHTKTVAETQWRNLRAVQCQEPVDVVEAPDSGDR